MTRKIKYKEVPEEYQKIGVPLNRVSSRASVGFESSIGEYYYIKVEDLIPFRNQARKIFKEDDLKALADSITLYGIRQPLTIIASDKEEGKYEVVSGERRLRAAKLAGLEKVPCIPISEILHPDAIALVENVHREDLHPIELMSSYQSLLENRIFSSIAEISQKTGIPRTTISETISLNKLPLSTQNSLLEKQIRTRQLLRRLLQSPEKDHETLINQYEEIIQKAKQRKKRALDQKIKILNIVHHSNNFIIESNRMLELDEVQKEEFKSILQDMIGKL